MSSPPPEGNTTAAPTDEEARRLLSSQSLSPSPLSLPLSDGEEEDEGAYESREKILIFDLESESTEELDYAVTPPFSWKKLWLFTGPGFLMSIAFLDPGNLEGDLQAGAIAGYSLLWLLMWATGMGLMIQLLSARVGVATGKHLAELCREEYPYWAGLLLWFMAELALIGADIQEVIGSAIAIQILSNGVLPLWAGVLITASDCFIFLLLENYGVRKLEAVFAVLILTMGLSFAWMFTDTEPSGKELLIVLVLVALLLSSSLLQTTMAGSGFCESKCGQRCSKASVQDMCLKYCGICCEECKCVPSGTYGHKDECPCYRDKKNSKGNPKCP